jgi:hypothetical protein
MSTTEIDKLVDRFLSWQLPKTVRADLCATDPSYAHGRYGTNLLTADEARQMIQHVLRGELDYRAYCNADPAHDAEGTRESLSTTAAMLETYGPECFPANERGQIDFARSMTDSAAAEIRAFLARHPSEPAA